MSEIKADREPHETNNSIRGAMDRWFAPPRAHGDVLQDRVVSFLELFYDLVFVVLIAQIAHTLADDVSWSGVRDFSIVFALIWIAWVNGSYYHELHGREDGRGRTTIFVQMGLLVLLAVYAAHAADDLADGRGFAIVYVILLSFIAWQWWGLRQYDTPEMAKLTARYVAAMAPVIGLVLISAFVDDPELRLSLWGGAIAISVASNVAQIFIRGDGSGEGFQISESMAERFGLFTIIVLGEVVVGVADGLSEVDRSARTIATGLLALSIGFGVWWNYFDLVGRRQPRQTGFSRGIWNLAHFPLWLSIAASGAGMVSLIESATDSRTPANTSWLIAGATAGIAFSLAAVATTMEPHPGRRLAPLTLFASGVIALVIGALRLPPLLLALALYALLSAVWMEVFVRHARAGTNITDH